MISEFEFQAIDQNRFRVLARTNHMVWIQSAITLEEFIVTDFNVASKYRAWRHGFQWSVYHRHSDQELCHYHANEKSFANAMRHITAHDRKAEWKQQAMCATQESQIS